MDTEKIKVTATREVVGWHFPGRKHCSYNKFLYKIETKVKQVLLDAGTAIIAGLIVGLAYHFFKTATALRQVA